MAEKYEHFDFEGMPPPSEAGAEFPHLGHLPKGAEDKLRQKGWRPVDIRGIVDSSAIKLMYQASRLGLIELSKPQLDALREERLYWETMSEIEERKKQSRDEKKVDILGLLEAFGASGVSVGLTPTSPPQRGRPRKHVKPVGEP